VPDTGDKLDYLKLTYTYIVGWVL